MGGHKLKLVGAKARRRRVEQMKKLPKLHAATIYVIDTAPSGEARANLAEEVSGEVKSKTAEDWLKPRTAKQNAIILNRQAKLGRRPEFLRVPELQEIRKITERAIRLFNRKGGDAVLRAMKVTADKIAKIYERHIDREQHIRGRFKALTPRYAGLKRNLMGGKELPILTRTGQLRRAYKGSARIL